MVWVAEDAGELAAEKPGVKHRWRGFFDTDARCIWMERVEQVVEGAGQDYGRHAGER